MLLTDSAFATIIAGTPLVSIDLIIKNEHNEVLLGKRHNRPAKGYWFVPGGRIQKDERLSEALNRIALAELRIVAGKGKLIGVFDHFYDDNVFGIPEVGTHYVALGYQLNVSENAVLVKDAQHTKLKWWTGDQLLASNEVHQNTKLYFNDACGTGLR